MVFRIGLVIIHSEFVVSKKGLVILSLLLVGLAHSRQACARAEEKLRIAVIETLDNPLNVFDKQHQLTGGLLKDYTDAIARGLPAQAVYQTYSRRRVEPALLRGDADLVCYFSPQWMDQSSDLQWSLPNLPQFERVLVRKGNAVPTSYPAQLKGKKIATQLAYHYPQIQQEVAAGKIQRLDQIEVASMFRLVAMGAADALITSDAEIEGYFKLHPEQRSQFSIAPAHFSRVYTQCALSPKSGWKLEQINRQIQRLLDSGEQSRLLHQYGLTEK